MKLVGFYSFKINTIIISLPMWVEAQTIGYLESQLNKTSLQNAIFTYLQRAEYNCWHTF